VKLKRHLSQSYQQHRNQQRASKKFKASGANLAKEKKTKRKENEKKRGYLDQEFFSPSKKNEQRR
jgi:Zn-dependent oligopeptidase